MRSRRSTRRSLIAMFVAVAAAMALPASAGANAPITAYSATAVDRAGRGPSRRGGPFRGRKPRPAAQPEPLQLRGRERRDRPPPAGVHRESPRNSAVLDRRVLRRRMPDRLPGGNRQRERDEWVPVQQPRSTTSSLRPTSRGFWASRSSSSTRPSSPCCRPAPEVTTASTPTRPRSTTASSRSRSSGRSSGASRRTTSHDLLRLDRTKVPGEMPSYLGELCDAERQPQHRRPEHDRPAVHHELHRGRARPLEQPAQSVPPEPDDLCRSAQILARCPLLRRGNEPRRPPVAGDDRLRPAQLQPEPLRAADHERDGLGIRDRGQPLGSTAVQPDNPLADGAARRNRHPARGLLDQLQRRRRQDVLLRCRGEFRHHAGSPLPRLREGRKPDDRQLRPAGPDPRLHLSRQAASRQSIQGLPRRRRLRHPRQAGGHRQPPTR